MKNICYECSSNLRYNNAKDFHMGICEICNKEAIVGVCKTLLRLHKRTCEKCGDKFETIIPSQFVCDKNHCVQCDKVFVSDVPYQIYCSKECHQKGQKTQEEIEKRFYVDCYTCGKTFRKKDISSGESTCESCHYATKRKHQINTYDNTKEKKKNKPKSLEELNRRAEYKRLMDENWAAREIRGRKWE